MFFLIDYFSVELDDSNIHIYKKIIKNSSIKKITKNFNTYSLTKNLKNLENVLVFIFSSSYVCKIKIGSFYTPNRHLQLIK